MPFMENIAIKSFKSIFLKSNKRDAYEVFLKEFKLKNKEFKNKEFENDLSNRFVKFSGFCLVTGTIYGLMKSTIIYNKRSLTEIYVPPNIFEKYSLFYANKFLLNGNLLFWSSNLLNKILF